jgi:ribosomal protein S18 acetylase RimI-like enzyme
MGYCLAGKEKCFMRAHSSEIIEASLKDIDALVVLFENYRHFYQQAPDNDGARTFLLQRLQERSSTIFLARIPTESEAQSVGFMQLFPTFDSLSLKPLWILNDLYVVPEARRQGIGQQLLQRARALAEQTHARGLMLQTAIDNHQAQSLYTAQNWIREDLFLTYNLDL